MTESGCGLFECLTIIMLDLHTKSAVCGGVQHGNTDRPSSSAGRDLLCGHLLTLPDNKIVEDIHQPIRLHSKGNVNRKQRSSRIQDIVSHSDVLQKRGVQCVCTVTKDNFLREFPMKTKQSFARMFQSRTHLLPVEWSRMCSTKNTWASWSEDTMQKAAAAWHWLHF